MSWAVRYSAAFAAAVIVGTGVWFGASSLDVVVYSIVGGLVLGLGLWLGDYYDGREGR